MSERVIPNVPAVGRELLDYTGARDRVLKLVAQGLSYLDEAETISNEFVPYGYPQPLGHNSMGIEQFRKELDGRYWRFVFDRTGAAALMDGEARKQFDDQLKRGDVPDFTQDNITTHFLSMSQEAEKMFSRGVYNLFRRYVREGERGYITNQKQPFALPRKLILSGWFSARWSRGMHVNYYRSDEVNDFGRIVNLLANRPYQPRGFEVEINAAMEKGSEFENDIVRVKAFRNGNAHLWIKDQQLLNRINATIASYCGDRLPEAANKNYGINTETTL